MFSYFNEVNQGIVKIRDKQSQTQPYKKFSAWHLGSSHFSSSALCNTHGLSSRLMSLAGIPLYSNMLGSALHHHQEPVLGSLQSQMVSNLAFCPWPLQSQASTLTEAIHSPVVSPVLWPQPPQFFILILKISEQLPWKLLLELIVTILTNFMASFKFQFFRAIFSKKDIV